MNRPTEDTNDKVEYFVHIRSKDRAIQKKGHENLTITGIKGTCQFIVIQMTYIDFPAFLCLKLARDLS